MEPDIEGANFGVLVPSFANAERIEVYRNGDLQDAIDRSANAPQVSIVSPAPGSTLDDNTIIEWQGSDADGDPLLSYIHYSPDAGVTWESRGARVTENSVPLNPQRLPSSDNAMIRVIVTDGFNTTVAQSTGLKLVPNRAPDALIVSPQSGDVFRLGVNVMLIGRAADPEDGSVSDGNMSWLSSIQGPLGTGPLFNVSSLRLGSHTIEYRATDSLGAASSDFVTIQVIP